MPEECSDVSHGANVRRLYLELLLSIEEFELGKDGLHHNREARLQPQVLVAVQPLDGGFHDFVGVGRKPDLQLPGLHGCLAQLHGECSPTVIEHLRVRNRSRRCPVLLGVLCC